jgi:hypothetical protein
MGDQKPPDWFGTQSTEAETEDFKRRKAAFLEELPRLLKERENRQTHGRDGKPGRAQNFYPYLMMRSLLGDRGDRPFNACFWESPDIWTAVGDPSTTPDLPPNHGGQVTAGQPATVYAHVWNLGFAPLAGIRVEFYWFNPSLGIDGAHGNLIGVARCELAGRGMAGSHKLVKCPVAWTPVSVNGGHECLVVRVSGIGDPIGGNAWQPWLNRHVAQRNISVVSAGSPVMQLIANLDISRFDNAHVQLLQLSPREGELARHIVAPEFKIRDIDSHVLGEIGLDGKIRLTMPTSVPAGMLASVHPLADGGPAPIPRLRPMGSTAVIDPMVSIRAFRGVKPMLREAQGRRGVMDSAHLHELLTGIANLHAGTDFHEAPAKGEAQVVRLASYKGEQLVGGYTMVITS